MQCIGKTPVNKMEKTYLQKTHAPHWSIRHTSVGASRESVLQCNGIMQPASVNTDAGSFSYIYVRFDRARSTGAEGKMQGGSGVKDGRRGGSPWLHKRGFGANRQYIVELLPTVHRRALFFLSRQRIVELRAGTGVPARGSVTYPAPCCVYNVLRGQPPAAALRRTS